MVIVAIFLLNLLLSHDRGHSLVTGVTWHTVFFLIWAIGGTSRGEHLVGREPDADRGAEEDLWQEAGMPRMARGMAGPVVS